MKAWQKGYDLEYLKELAARFQEHDGDRCLGAFSKVKENTVADWLSKGRLIETPSGAVACRVAKANQPVRDFRGVKIATAFAHSLVVERVCGKAEDIYEAIYEASFTGKGRTFEKPILWKSWPDHLEELSAASALDLKRIGTTISAASEIKSILARRLKGHQDGLREIDQIGITECADIEMPEAQAATTWPQIVKELWADHYSSYNKRKSWHAVSLRSFGGDISFIEKPAEMSKKWKQEHSDMLDAECIDTLLMEKLPSARSILDRIQAPKERVRLMRLTGDGGELTRHADITDRNAGLEDGQIARLHYPLVTNPQVQFTSWNLNNAPNTTHMEAGKWWYLDVRKPHAAVNAANSERIHLVVDAVVNDWVRSFIANESVRSAQ